MSKDAETHMTHYNFRERLTATDSLSMFFASLTSRTFLSAMIAYQAVRLSQHGPRRSRVRIPMTEPN